MAASIETPGILTVPSLQQRLPTFLLSYYSVRDTVQIHYTQKRTAISERYPRTDSPFELTIRTRDDLLRQNIIQFQALLRNGPHAELGRAGPLALPLSSWIRVAFADSIFQGRRFFLIADNNQGKKTQGLTRPSWNIRGCTWRTDFAQSHGEIEDGAWLRRCSHLVGQVELADGQCIENPISDTRSRGTTLLGGDWVRLGIFLECFHVRLDVTQVGRQAPRAARTCFRKCTSPQGKPNHEASAKPMRTKAQGNRLAFLEMEAWKDPLSKAPSWKAGFVCPGLLFVSCLPGCW